MAAGEIQIPTEVQGEETDELRLLEKTISSDSIVEHNVQLPAIEVSDPWRNPCMSYYALKCVIGASITTNFLGFDIGVMSDATAYIDKDKRITNERVDKLTGYIYFISIFGSLIAGRISDWIGRRSTIMWAGGFFSVGTLLTGFARNDALIMVGRIVNPVSLGLALMIAPVYIAELSPDPSRGFFTSFPQLAINFGTFLGQLCNYFIPKLKLSQHFMVGLGVISPFLVAIGAFTMPESPRWLVMQGHVGDAKEILDRNSNSQQEASHRLDEIMEAVGNMQSTGRGVWRELFFHRASPVWHINMCVLGLNIMQQASGIEIILLYSNRIFEKTGITAPNKNLFWAVIVHIVKAVCILIPTFYLDVVGRKKLLLRSIGGMTISLASLGTCLYIIDVTDTSDQMRKWAVALSIPLLLLSVAFFSSGLGPIASVYSSEIFPMRLRAQGYAVGVATNQATGLLLSTIVSQHYNATTAVFSFMVCGFLAFAFVYFIVPETRGRTLEDLWQLFGEFIVSRSRAGEIEPQRSSEATEAVAGSTAGDIELQRKNEATEAAVGEIEAEAASIDSQGTSKQKRRRRRRRE